MPEHHVAQLNIAKFRFPTDSPEVAEFFENLDRINRIAENSHGFVWRYKTLENDTKEAELFGEGCAVNLSVWDSIDNLKAFVYRSDHLQIMKRRQEWFQKPQEVHLVLWRIDNGVVPTLQQAKEKLLYLRRHGSSAEAFQFQHTFAED